MESSGLGVHQRGKAGVEAVGGGGVEGAIRSFDRGGGDCGTGNGEMGIW